MLPFLLSIALAQQAPVTVPEGPALRDAIHAADTEYDWE